MTNAAYWSRSGAPEPDDEPGDGCISLLRQRLGLRAARLVQTVRGVGYVLKDDLTTSTP